MSTLLLIATALSAPLCLAEKWNYDGGELARELRSIRRALYPKGDAPVGWEKEFMRKLGDSNSSPEVVSELRGIRLELEAARRVTNSSSRSRCGGSSVSHVQKKPSKGLQTSRLKISRLR